MLPVPISNPEAIRGDNAVLRLRAVARGGFMRSNRPTRESRDG